MDDQEYEYAVQAKIDLPETEGGHDWAILSHHTTKKAADNDYADLLQRRHDFEVYLNAKSTDSEIESVRRRVVVNRNLSYRVARRPITPWEECW
jgi:hypothetical protein